MELVEEAMHALRVCPLRVLSLYYVGTLPFVLGFFFFWSDMSRSSFALERSVGASLVMMALYFWMKMWQALFCRGILEEWTPRSEMARLSRGGWVRCALAQGFLHSAAIPLQLFGLLLIVPAAWVFTFFQNVTVLAFTQELGEQPTRKLYRLAVRQCRYLPRQNHLMILVGMLFSVLVWLNVYSVLFTVPFLLKRLLGIESVFTVNPGAAIFNTTFFAASIAIAFLCVSPLVKILYTLRCYYGLSTTTGADLLRRLDFIRRAQGAGGRAVVLALFLLVAVGSVADARDTTAVEEPTAAEESAVVEQRAAPVRWGELDEAIEDVIERREYTWRMPRERPGAEERGPVARFFLDTVDWIVGFLGTVKDEIDKLINLIVEWLFGSDAKDRDRAPPETDWESALLGLVYLLAGLLLLLVLVLAIRAYRRRGRPDAVVDAGDLRVAAVDLESEEIVASQLPEDEWMSLAREQMEKGDYRLAVRALFLASLACLGEKRLVHVEKSKSNMDYQRELGFRARDDVDMLRAFSDNVGIFERAWYGLHGVSEEVVNHFFSNYRRIASHGR